MSFPPYTVSCRGRSCARSRILARVDCAVSEYTDPNSASGLSALPDTHSAREPRSHVPSRGSFADSDHPSYFDPNRSPQRVRRNSIPLVSPASDHPEHHVIAPRHLRAVSPCRAANIHEAAAVRSLHFLLEGEARTFYESFAARGTLSETRSREFMSPHVVHALLDRYLTDSELQKAHDRVTLISQKPAEDENAYADRIIVASHDFSNVFEDHKLVHYSVRGLLETSSDKVIEDMRRLPEHERHDLTLIRRLAFAQGNTIRAQSHATAKARTPSHRRTPTIYVSEEQQPEPYFRNSDLPHLLNHRAGMLSDFRVRDPETARNIAIGLESILFPGATSGSTTPTSMNSDAIAASVGVDLVRTPVHRKTVPIPTLTEEKTRQAFSVVPSDYWQLNFWTCRDCRHSTFTCPTLTPSQRMYFAYRYYLDQIKGNPAMAKFLEQKTERRVQLAKERAEYDGKHPRR